MAADTSAVVMSGGGAESAISGASDGKAAQVSDQGAAVPQTLASTGRPPSKSSTSTAAMRRPALLCSERRLIR